MRLYQFTLPTHSNNGLSYELSRKRWAAEAVKLAGGVTAPQAFKLGTWKNDEGREFKETVAEYTVLCTEKTADALTAFAFEQFPDQEALFVAIIGEAHVVSRPVAA